MLRLVHNCKAYIRGRDSSTTSSYSSLCCNLQHVCGNMCFPCPSMNILWTNLHYLHAPIMCCRISIAFTNSLTQAGESLPLSPQELTVSLSQSTKHRVPLSVPHGKDCIIFPLTKIPFLAFPQTTFIF